MAFSGGTASSAVLSSVSATLIEAENLNRGYGFFYNAGINTAEIIFLNFDEAATQNVGVVIPKGSAYELNAMNMTYNAVYAIAASGSPAIYYFIGTKA